MRRFNVTYDIVTPESAEYGDSEECGFIDSRGWQVPLPDDMCGEPAGQLKAACAMSLRQALNQVSGCFDSGSDGLAYYEADGRVNCQDSSEERRAFHLPDNATAASVARVARLLEYKLAH